MWWSLWLVAALGLAGPVEQDTAADVDGLDEALLAANRVDAGIFAPGPYLKALHLLLWDEEAPAERTGDRDPDAAWDEATRLFRTAEKAARTEGPAIVRNGRLRHAAVRSFVDAARADWDGGDTYRAAAALAARAESLAADPGGARAAWDEAVDSLVIAAYNAEVRHARQTRGEPALPYIAYDS